MQTSRLGTTQPLVHVCVDDQDHAPRELPQLAAEKGLIVSKSEWDSQSIKRHVYPRHYCAGQPGGGEGEMKQGRGLAQYSLCSLPHAPTHTDAVDPHVCMGERLVERQLGLEISSLANLTVCCGPGPQQTVE